MKERDGHVSIESYLGLWHDVESNQLLRDQ